MDLKELKKSNTVCIILVICTVWRVFMYSLDRYIEWLHDSGFSDNTVRFYGIWIDEYIRWLYSEYGVVFDGSISEIEVRTYTKYLLIEKKLSPVSVNAKISALQSFLNFSSVNVALPRVKSVNVPKVIVLSESDLFRCRRYVHRSGDVLKIAVFELILNTGLRESEVAALELDDIVISDRKGYVIVRNGKGGKYREVPLNKIARRSLLDYLSERNDKFESRRVFIGQRGALSSQGIYRIISRIGKAVLQGRAFLSPQILRHQCFTNMFQKKVQIEVIATIAGHASITTTKNYYLHVSFEKMEQAVDLLDI